MSQILKLSQISKIVNIIFKHCTTVALFRTAKQLNIIKQEKHGARRQAFHFNNVFTFRFPFDWKNPIGYLIAVGLQLIMVFIALHYVACFLTLAIGSVMFSLSIAEDIKDSLIFIDESAKSKQSLPHMMKQLIELIRFTNLRKLSIQK